MVVVDSQGKVYSTLDGLDPNCGVKPFYYIFTPTGFGLRVDNIVTKSPFGRIFVEQVEKVAINPWTYWTKEEKLQSIRLQRDFLLAKTDWRVVKAAENQDATSDAWKNYRQALRDFPDNVNVDLPIEQIVWPAPPS